ncbi:DUF1804 family protein [uncultured Fusobacterium sp.]|uniref:DUF1804 family protein n=1 Tax=uncultured Fusobacterium sp. TaxID=159267 RepID=UPI0015A5E931|nr:DUF1804 family protein [uncultured Fusobacterium sp.]DAQ00432.1 MAG TPA: Protein of unknown function (DUF1804) [Caudoviricetes sp.]
MSNPTRAPTREEVRKYYEQNKVSLSECANHFGISENTVKSWKKRDKAKGDDWVHLVDFSGAPTGASAKSKKQLINKAKSIVISGGTIKEASDQTGLSETSLKNYSAKGRWLDQQEEFLKFIYGRLQEEEGEKHIQRRKETIEYLNYIQKKAMSKLTKGELGKDFATILNTVVNIVQKTIEGQAQLLGIPEMRMNIKKDEEPKELNTKDRTVTIKVVKNGRNNN